MRLTAHPGRIRYIPPRTTYVPARPFYTLPIPPDIPCRGTLCGRGVLDHPGLQPGISVTADAHFHAFRSFSPLEDAASVARRFADVAQRFAVCGTYCWATLRKRTGPLMLLILVSVAAHAIRRMFSHFFAHSRALPQFRGGERRTVVTRRFAVHGLGSDLTFDPSDATSRPYSFPYPSTRTTWGSSVATASPSTARP